MFRRPRILLLGVLGLLAFSVAARFLRLGPYPSQGAEEREVPTSLWTYRGKLAAAQAVLREHPRAREVVFRVANREDAEARGLLSMKKFDLGAAHTRYLFYAGHINYVDENGEVVEADPTFIVQPDGAYVMTKASYRVLAPQFADGVLQFTVDGTTVTFKALGLGTSTPAAIPHVQGIPQANRVIYADAFGTGIDYVIQAEPDELRKLVVFRTPPTLDGDLRVEFATSLADTGTIRGRNTRFGATFFRQPSIWDSAGRQEEITVELSGGKMTKVLPASFFQSSPESPPQYPVMTDVTTSYYAGAGDGYVYYSLANQSTWATAHDDTGTNATADYTGTTGRISSQADSGGYKPMRAFYPIDTSGIANSDEITAARLKLWATATTDNDNDGNDYINVVQTTQADTASLIAADYDQCGSTHSPTTGATSVDIGTITTSAYNTLTLNATGEGWIDKTGTTKLGAREGHDLADDIPGSTNDVTFSTSEASGTSQDPVLEVDTTAAVISSVTTQRTIFATSTANILVSSSMTGETSASSTLEYVVFFDNDGDNTPDTNETYVTGNCAGSALWSAGQYTFVKSGFTIADGESPKTHSWECANTNFPENGLYTIYLKWKDADGTIATLGTTDFQSCDQPTGTDNWYDTNYENRRIMQFRNQDRASALINFPVLMYATTTNFDLNALISPNEVRFLDDDGTTVLQHELERYATTSEAVFWVKVPKVATSTACDFVTMYYDYTGASDVATTTGVWDENYRAVYHFGQTSGNYNDSTRNAEHCTTVTVNSRTATGPFGSLAPDFEATAATNRLTCGQMVLMGDLTHEVWFQLESGSVARPITQHAANGETKATNIVFGFETDASNNFWSQHETNAGTNVTIVPATPITATVGAWTMATMARSSSTPGTYTFYKNGSQSGSVTTYTDDPNGGDTGTALYVGGRISSAVWFDGLMDELRISDSVRSGDWIAASASSTQKVYVDWGAEATNTAALQISSAANQTFVVNQSTTAISTITITEGTSPSITDANNIRIRIPSTFNMVFYTSDTAANIGGSDWAKTGAASQGGEVAVTYEDSNKTVVVPVTTNFDALDDITVYGLSFTSFTAVSSADNLELEVDNGGTVAATDGTTITIVAPTLSSYANQTFTVSQAMTTSSPMTITDATSATITNTSNIRIRIPTGFNMVWDTADTIIKVAPTLADYTSFYSTNDLPTVTIDVSDVTYNTTTDTLFVVINGTPTIYEYTLGGSLSRTINMNGFIDTEGIDWMYGNKYVLTEERDPYDIIVVTLDNSTTTLAKSEGTVIDVGFTCTTNLCLEGIRYDVANDWFYAVTEKQAGGGNGGRVFRVNNDATYTEFTDLGTALSNAGYTDLASLAYDEVTKDLFLLSEENNIIIQATTTGTIRGTRAVDTGIFTQPEGLDFSSNYDSMFIVGESDDYQRLTRDSKINNTCTFEDSSMTLVLDVTGDFTASETRTVGFVSFKSFTASSAADNLELEVTNDANIQDYDDKTIEITGGASLSVVASTTVLTFPAVTYNFSSQTTTATNAAQGSARVVGGSGNWTLNLNCNANGQQCYWNGPTERDRFRLRGGLVPSGVPSTTGLFCLADPFTCNVDGGGACTGVTLSGLGCIATASTKTVATGSMATSDYYLKEADWAQGIPGGTSAGVYTTVITWDLQ